MKSHGSRKNETWEWTDLPNSKKTVDCTWIFIIKHKVDGSIYQFKVLQKGLLSPMRLIMKNVCSEFSCQ